MSMSSLATKGQKGTILEPLWHESKVVPSNKTAPQKVLFYLQMNSP